MNSCNTNHKRIKFTGDSCPLCEMALKYGQLIVDTNNVLENMKKELETLKGGKHAQSQKEK